MPFYALKSNQNTRIIPISYHYAKTYLGIIPWGLVEMQIFLLRDKFKINAMRYASISWKLELK